MIPETYNRQDWPRLVSNTVSRLSNVVREALASITALEGRATALETDVDALQAADTVINGRLTTLETLTNYAALADYADDTAAAAGGVPIDGLYRNGSALMVRVA